MAPKTSPGTSETRKARRGPGRPRQPLPKHGNRSTSNPNVVGPASKLTAEIADRIVEAIRLGNRIDVAGRANGVATDTLMLWLRKGREAKSGGYYELAQRVDQALADSEIRDLATIDAASAEQWTAAAWKLERRYPERYGRRTKLEGQVDVRGVPYIDPSRLTDEELVTLVELTRKAQPQLEDIPKDGRPALELLAGGES